MAEIYVYASDCEDFSNFGLVGALTPTECIFEEEGNGMSELTLTHPLDEQGRYAALEWDRLLAAEVPVRTTPEIENGAIVTSVEQWTVRSAATVPKKMRYLYKRKSGSSRLKVLPGGTTVTVVNKPDDGRYKVKCRYGTGYMEPDGLTYSTTETIADNSQSIESVQPAWTVKMQLFRIYSVEKGIDEVKVSARHISYDLLYNITNFKSTAAVSCKTALAAIMDNCCAEHEFEAFTNLDDTRTGLNWTRVNPIHALLDPDEGLTAQYGAALVRDNWELYILHDPGLNRGVTVEYAKNMTGISFTENAEDVATRIIPVGEKKDGSDLLLAGNTPWVDSEHIGDYPTPRIQVLKCKDCKVGTDGVTTAIARARMQEQARAVFDAGGDLPEIEMSVEFVSLGDTVEYAQYKDLDRLFLWDYVIVRHKKQNIDVTARVVSIRWDCLLGRMRSMEVGRVGKTLANSGITTWQIPEGFSGGKIANGTVGSNALMEAIIAARHLQAESVSTDALQAGSVTTEKLAAGSITADKIKTGELDAITLEAVTAKISTFTAKDIETDRLAAALAAFTVVTAGTATFDKATVSHLVAEALNLQYGVAGTVFIKNLAVEYAQMIGAAIGNLCIKASDGNYYNIDVDRDGSITATKTTVSAGEIAAGQTNGGQVILETNITAANLSTSNLIATYALVNRIDAARIDVDELFAREAFIDMLRTSRIFADKSLEIIVGEAASASRVFRQEDFPDGSALVKPGDLLVQPSTGKQYQAVEAGNIAFALDENGNLHYDYDGDGSLSMDGFNLCADGFTLSIMEDGSVSVPYRWALVRDLELQTQLNAQAEQMANTVLKINQDIADIQDQLDGNITTWFEDYIPTTSNAPASTWTTADLKNQHLGDLFYVDNASLDENGYCYRWQQSGGTYGWVRVSDSGVTKALADAAKAQDTADGKRRVFVAQPTPPYDVGDLWAQGSGGDLMRCSTAKSAGQSYAASDWVKASKYTDDTKANAAQNTANAAQSTANNAQSTANGAQETADMAGNYANEALDKANNALTQAEFKRVVRIDDEGLHVGDNLTGQELLLASGHMNVVIDGVNVATYADKFIRMGNMQVRKVRGGLAISVYRS